MSLEEERGRTILVHEELEVDLLQRRDVIGVNTLDPERKIFVARMASCWSGGKTNASVLSLSSLSLSLSLYLCTSHGISLTLLIPSVIDVYEISSSVPS